MREDLSERSPLLIWFACLFVCLWFVVVCLLFLGGGGGVLSTMLLNITKQFFRNRECRCLYVKPPEGTVVNTILNDSLTLPPVSPLVTVM